jgi:hypothetical protein
MRQLIKIGSIGLLALAVLGCNARTDKTDGPVILTIVGTTTIVIPLSESVSAATQAGGSAIGSMTLTTVLKEPNGTSSPLESVEMDSYQVTYARADRGTRVPPPFSQSLFGSIAPGGTDVLTNFPWIGLAQLTSSPLVDLAQRGLDPETGSATIRLNVSLVFFAHTFSGKRVTSDPQTFTVEMLP